MSSDWTRGLSRTARAAKAAKSSQPDRPVAEQALALLDGGAAPADRQRAHDAFALLALTPSGREDLQAMVEHGVTLSFNMSSGGAGYQIQPNHIVLNRTQVVARTALDLTHELTHARLHNTGYGANIHGEKDDYVNGILREESQTFFREAIVGRELVHLADPVSIKHVLTVHPVQMWFALVHNVPYHKPPSPAVLDADAALTAATLSVIVDELMPYFLRYVQYYRLVEAAKWDIAHGLRKPEKQEVISGVIGDCAAEQKHEWTYPRRRT